MYNQIIDNGLKAVESPQFLLKNGFDINNIFQNIYISYIPTQDAAHHKVKRYFLKELII